MAIDHIPYPDAHDLAHLDKAFYPVRIPVSHWQLRHYISTPEPDLLYYASGQDIFCLDTRTKKRKHVATLPFEARCTASGYGWVCVGGEDEGHFAAIKLDGSPQAQQRDVDTALPIDEHWRPGGVARRAASIKVERIGEEIVNSISIHRIQDEEAHLDDIVAVLTNNDKTVRIYSLPAGQETRVKDLPFAMNHATISPDGQTLVAVGDYNQAYFFAREVLDTPPQIPKPHNRLTSASVEWTLTNVVTLYVSSPEATIGFFTTAWSPNGRLVAVGSEGGYIAVLDMDILANADYNDEDAVVATVPGSRADMPSPHPGAVRSMMFSPEPWDLLIWAEDQGRVCVGDLRTALKKRQIVHLEPKDETLTKLTFDDVPPDEISSISPHLDDLEAELLRHYRSDSSSAVTFAAEYIEARRRLRQRTSDLASQRSQTSTPGSRPPLEDDPQGLTAREQQVLETLRTVRQREEARSGGQAARSFAYTSSDLFTGANGGSRATASSTNTPEPPRPLSDILSSVHDSFPELSRTYATASPRPSSSHGQDPPSPLPPLQALQDGVWGSTRGSSGVPRLGDSSRLPRRRASVVLNPLPSENDVASRATPTAITVSTASADSASGNMSLSNHSSTPVLADAEEENPWRIIEEQITAARGPLFETAAASPHSSAAERHMQADLQSELETQQRIRVAQQTQRQRDHWRGIRSSSTTTTAPVDTTNDARMRFATRSTNGNDDARIRVATRSTNGNDDTRPRLATRSTNGNSNTDNSAQPRRLTAVASSAAAAASTAAYTTFERPPSVLLESRRPVPLPDGYGTLLRRTQLRAVSGREIGVRTAGLAMSGDGSVVWAACEEGIFEIRLRLKGRMFWPALDMC